MPLGFKGHPDELPGPPDEFTEVPTEILGQLDEIIVETVGMDED